MKSKKISNLWNSNNSSQSSSGKKSLSPPSSPNNSTDSGSTSPLGHSSSHHHHHHHYEGFVFGIGLNDFLKRESSVNGIPSIVIHISDNIRSSALKIEGIFRVPGSNLKLQQLKKAYNQGKINTREQLNERCDDIHTQASLLKLFIRELPDPLFTFQLYDEFVRSHSNLDKPSRVGSLKMLLKKLPTPHYQLIKYLASLLREIASYSPINKMPSTNLAIIFGPTVMRPRNEDVVRMIEDARHVNGVFLLVIDEFDYLFQGAEFPTFILNPSLSSGSLKSISSPISTLLTTANHNNSPPINIGSNSASFGTLGSKRLTYSSIEDFNSPSSPIILEDHLSTNILRSPPVPPPSPSSSPHVTNNNNNSNNQNNKNTPKFSILLPTSNQNNLVLSPNNNNSSNNTVNNYPSPSLTYKTNPLLSGISLSPLLSPLPPASPRNSLILQDDNSEVIRNLIHKTCSLLFDKDFFVNEFFEIPNDENLLPAILNNKESNTADINGSPSSPSSSSLSINKEIIVNSPSSPNQNIHNLINQNETLLPSSPRKHRVLGIPTSNGESTSSPQLRTLLKSHVNNLNINNNGVTVSNTIHQTSRPLSTELLPQKSPLDLAMEHLSNIRKDSNRPFDPNQMTPKELNEEKSAIKKELRDFDVQFKRDKGLLPKKSDKEIMRPLYHRYREIKLLIENYKRLNQTLNNISPNNNLMNTASVTNNQLQSSSQSINTIISNISTSSNSKPNNLTSPTKQNNIKSFEKMSRQELKEIYHKVKSEKKTIQIELHKYQTDFMKKHGRKVQFIEDRIPVQPEYEKYKELKNEITELEKLLNITPQV